MKIAVIGAGAAGITAAYILERQHEVTLFEKNDYIGGHTNTIVIEKGPDAGTPVDTGFIVLNNKNYPTLTTLLSQLGVSIRNSDMSFSYYSEESGFQYSSNVPDGLFAQRKNILSPSFWKMIGDILRFNEDSRKKVREGHLRGVSLGQYLEKGNFSKSFIQNYVIAMGAAIWSTSPKQMLDFPAENFIRFFENHGLLTFKDRPQWQSVVGGSQSYVKAFLKGFKGKVYVNAGIRDVRRRDNQVIVRREEGEEAFDKVVIASHADEALKLLADPSKEESRLLGAWSYTQNHTVLHTDASVMPPIKRAWASWNYVREAAGNDGAPVSVSYHMNRLQGLKTQKQYFVTLNRNQPVSKDCILKEIHYTHPLFTYESIQSQEELPKLNGVLNTYFCGSYFGYGFHEDAVKSGVAVAKLFGLNLGQAQNTKLLSLGPGPK